MMPALTLIVTGTNMTSSRSVQLQINFSKRHFQDKNKFRMYHEMHFWIFTQSRQNIVDIGLTFKKRTCQSEIDYLFHQIKKDVLTDKSFLFPIKKSALKNMQWWSDIEHY